MPDVDPDPEIADLNETAQRMMTLAQRSLAAVTKIQSRSVAQATGSEYSLMDAATLARAYGNVWTRLMTQPQELWSAQLKAGTSLARAWGAMMTEPDEDTVSDRRFRDHSWSEDPLSRGYRDAFLAFESAMEGLLDTLTEEGRDDLRVRFYTRQAISALSPANFLATNAAARSTLPSKGTRSPWNWKCRALTLSVLSTLRNLRGTWPRSMPLWRRWAIL